MVDTDPTFASGYNGILLSGGAIDQSGFSDIRLVTSGGQTLTFRGSLQSDFSPSTMIKASLMDMSGGGMPISGGSNSLATFTAVPAPLPLLGLGAATAFSRKLKQRIALKRKQEEVGAAV